MAQCKPKIGVEVKQGVVTVRFYEPVRKYVSIPTPDVATAYHLAALVKLVANVVAEDAEGSQEQWNEIEWIQKRPNSTFVG